MTRAWGQFVAAICILLALAGSGRAATLQAGAIALTPGDYLTLDGLQISVSAETCDNGGGNGRGGNPGPVACGDLFLAPVSGPDPEVIIEAANGDTAGVSTLVPIFSYSCPASGSCTTGTYDLSVTLDVQAETASDNVTDVSQVLTGSATPSSLASTWPADVHLGETVTAGGGSSVCSEQLNVANATAACPAFAAQSTLSISKDLGLSLSGVTNGSALTLWSVAQIFTPAPEPASVAVLLGSLVALGAVRRRRC